MKRVPNIYIVGAQKSGTTTLYGWLAQHPQIYGSPSAKDFPYFSSDRAYRNDAKRFLSFSKAASPNNLVLGADVNAMYVNDGAQRMHQTIPDAKLIVMLRNPVERAYSGFCFAIERLLEERTFQCAINDELNGMLYEPTDALQRDYLGHGKYANQLKQLYRYYPKSQVKVVIFEEFVRDSKRVLGDIFSFAQIDDAFVPNMIIWHETKGGSRFKLLANIIHRPPSSEFIRSIAKNLIPFAIRKSIRWKLAEFNRIAVLKPEFSTATRIMLQEYFAQEIPAVEEVLGRKIPIWYPSNVNQGNE